MYKRYLILITAMASFALSYSQSVPFNGLLTDLNGHPLKNAKVYVNNNVKDYALTNKQGQFGLTNVKPTDTLRVVVKGAVQVIPVNGKRSVNIRLDNGNRVQTEEDAQLVDIGFGYVSRRERTSASNYISGDELRKSGATTVLGSLQGRIPGLNITGSTSAFGGTKEVSMRGTRSFTADSTPLFVIDNTVVPSFDGLNLNDIDYVEIMKEASIYGSSGANGAIILHTKMAK